jgi:hypothetical protein
MAALWTAGVMQMETDFFGMGYVVLPEGLHISFHRATTFCS